MKKTIITIVLLLAACGIALTKVEAQELVRESDCVKFDTSIICEVEYGKWLVCQGYKDDYYPRFSLVTESGTTISELTLFDHEMHIFDMKVYGEGVYFCGYRIDAGNKKAVLGHFNLSGFPSSQVYLYQEGSLESFCKLEIYSTWNPYREHVEMIGVKQDGTYVMTDAKQVSSLQYNFLFREISDDHDILDDIAVLDDYIVFSGRNTTNTTGYLYYVDKENGENPILPTSIQRLKLYQMVFSPILLEYQTGDEFALVTEGDMGYLTLSFYSAVNWIAACQFPGYANRYRYREIKYNNTDNVFGLLLYEPATGNSIIYDIYKPILSMKYVAGHLFLEQDLQSMDYLSLQAGHYIASGQHLFRGPLRIYRVHSSTWKSCFEEVQMDGYYYIIEHTQNQLGFIATSSIKEADAILQGDRQDPIVTICESKQ